MFFPTDSYSISRRDLTLLSKCRNSKLESPSSLIRRLATTYIDGSKGFSGRGFLLFGKAFPMPWSSRRDIYVRILQEIHNMDPSALDLFYEKSGLQFRRNRRLTIRPIAKFSDELYLNKYRHYKPYEKLGAYFLATADNVGSFAAWLNILLDANDLNLSELDVFWD